MAVQFQSLQNLGVMCEGLGEQAPTPLVECLLSHLLDRKLHLAPGVALVYVPERFEVHCHGLQIPLDITECEFSQHTRVKIMTPAASKRSACYLRLGNVHLQFEDNTPPEQACEMVMAMLRELRVLATQAIGQRLVALQKKQGTLQGRPEVMMLANEQQQLICKQALRVLALDGSA